MDKPRELVEEEIQQSPVLHDLLQSAKVSGQLLVTYHGATYAITPGEDITHTFTQEELVEFAEHYAAADDPANHLTIEEALARYREQTRRYG